MNAETILYSDVLDILFENRNKEYGAYQLRKGYDKRLLKSLSVILSLVVLLFVWAYIQNNMKPKTNVTILSNAADSSIHLTQIEIPKDPKIPKPQTPVASITNPTPVIVPDKFVKDTMHTIDDMIGKVISDVTVDGPAATSDNQSSAPEIHGNDGKANAEPIPPPEPAVIVNPEVMPEFPGGTAALLRFLGKNLQVPEDALEAGQRVRVPVKFVVNKEGNLSDVEFLTQTDNIFRKEILRVVAKMPKWKPGSQHGKAVSVYYTIPVIFDMTEN
jgi:periplasmic protein TonB